MAGQRSGSKNMDGTRPTGTTIQTPHPSRDKYQYENLVKNIAQVFMTQIQLYSKQVPDTIAKNKKEAQLYNDVMAHMEDMPI